VDMSIEKINTALLEKKMNFIFMDTLQYRITYSNNNNEKINLTGRFDQPLENENLKLVVKTPDLFSEKNIQSNFEGLKNIDLLFDVHTY
jgi:hypothetical protein